MRMQRTPRTRKLTAAATITAAVLGFGACGWALVDNELDNQRVYEQAATAYNPPPILNYITEDPDDVWQDGGAP